MPQRPSPVVSGGTTPPPAARPHTPGVARAGWLLLAVCLFIGGAAAGAAWVYFALERPALEAARSRIDRYEQDLAALRGHLDDARSSAAAFEGGLMVEESTRRGLEVQLRTVQEELGRARDTLAFYEQLMPPGPKGAVSVRGLDIERVGPNLRYRVLLMRSGANDKPFRGRLQFMATGRQDGKEVTHELLPTTVPQTSGQPSTGPADAKEAAPDLEFTEFQRSSGLLGLPEGFVPLAVTVNVLEGDTVRVSRSFDLPASK